MKPLDQTDQRILDLLQRDGRMTVKEMSSRLNLSTTPIFERIKKLERSGIIDHYSAILNAEKLGMKLNAFLHISVKDHTKELVEEFVENIIALPEVMECHYVTGASDFILKVLVEDMEQYKAFVMDKLFAISNIDNVESYLSLAMRKKTSLINIGPVEEEG